ncbi:energy transducer TonB [Paraburkholderia caffeinilytica]|uniref:energy transducer TonB n=1 Tax=Paraburkholderia caffeinilytica TaxID=1761016 RepID=UPI003DA178F2
MATTGYTAIDAARRRRVVVALGAVIAAHAGLLVWALAVRDRTVERTVEEPTIVAALLRDEPAAIAPVVPAPAAVSAAPQAGHPPVRSKPLPQPRLKAPSSAAAPGLTTAPLSRDMTRETTPSPGPAAPPVAAEPSPATSAATPAATASATAAGRTVPATSTPRSVSHIDCDIPKPDYPDISKRRNESGTAIVRFVVGLSGRIETAQLQKSSGYPRLDDAALAAIHGGTCQPYRENGEAVRAAYSQSFVFGLTD